MEINTLVMLKEREPNPLTDKGYDADRARLVNHTNAIKRMLSEIQTRFLQIAYRLIEVEGSGAYKVCYNPNGGSYCRNVYDYAFIAFGFSKTTSFNLIAVARNFSEGFRGLKQEYEGYGLSQLVELLPVPRALHKYFDPRMTVKEMRELRAGKRVFAPTGVWCDVPAVRVVDAWQIPPAELEKHMPPPEPPPAGALAGQIFISDVVQASESPDNHVPERSDVGTVNAAPEYSDIGTVNAAPEHSDVGTVNAAKIPVPVSLYEPLWKAEGYDIPITALREMASRILGDMEDCGEYNAAVYKFYNKLRSKINQYVIGLEREAGEGTV
jgi:hypothetical protein